MGWASGPAAQVNTMCHIRSSLDVSHPPGAKWNRVQPVKHCPPSSHHPDDAYQVFAEAYSLDSHTELITAGFDPWPSIEPATDTAMLDDARFCYQHCVGVALDGLAPYTAPRIHVRHAMRATHTTHTLTHTTHTKRTAPKPSHTTHHARHQPPPLPNTSLV